MRWRENADSKLEIITFLFYRPNYQTFLFGFGVEISKLALFTFLFVFGLDKRGGLRRVGVHRKGALAPMAGSAGKRSGGLRPISGMKPAGDGEVSRIGRRG
jgi:hypothetical protein